MVISRKKKNEYFLQNIKPNTQKFCDKGSSKSFTNLEPSESLNFVIKILICTKINDSYQQKTLNILYVNCSVKIVRIIAKDMKFLEKYYHKHIRYV